MEHDTAKLIRDAVSSDRLAPYLTACDDDLLAAHRLYAWNLEISAALHGPLSFLEIVVRNALHDQLSALHGQPEWWKSAHLKLQRATLANIKLAHDRVAARRHTTTPGRIVAELSFGFWVALLRSEYEMTLWRPALHRAFRQYHGRRSHLHEDLRHMVILRNRIAHHEPIHHRHLSSDHETILRLIAYISAATAGWVASNDRVTAVLSRRESVCRGTADTSF